MKSNPAEPFARLFRNLPVRGKILFLVGTIIISALLFNILLIRSLGTLFVGGPLYATVVTGHQLSIDIALPSCTIIEPYQIAMQLADSNCIDRVVANTQNLQRLRQVYDERMNFWKSHIADSSISRELMTDAREPGDKFFAAVETQLIPAVQSGNYGDARNVLQWYLTPYYDQHRSAIDHVVMLCDSMQQRIETAAAKRVSDMTRAAIVAALLLIAVMIGIGLLIAHMIVAPLRAGERHLATISSGDFSSLLDIDRTDEVGRMGVSMNHMSQELSRTLGEISDATHNVKQSALALNGLSGTVTQTAKDIRQSTTAAAEGSILLAQGAETILHDAQTIASATGSIAAAIEEMQASVGEVVRQCSEETRIANQAIATIRTTKERMNALGEAARNVSKVTELISGIAEQTHLLSINAAIEASAAGDAGRGFAVVATEVRELSQRTAASAAQIAQEVSTMLTEVERTQTGTDETQVIMEKSASIASIIELSMQQQGLAIGEIAQNIATVESEAKAAADSAGDARNRAQEMQVSVENAGNATGETVGQMEELLARAQELGTIADSLLQRVSAFRLYSSAADS